MRATAVSVHVQVPHRSIREGGGAIRGSTWIFMSLDHLWWCRFVCIPGSYMYLHPLLAFYSA